MGGTRRHVLVVEDDADTCHLLVEMLRDAGYSAECQMTTAGAIEHLRGQRTDLVIADLLMGDEDGRSFLELRKADPGLFAMPVIVHSGHPHANAVVAQAPSTTVLLKPVDLHDFLDAVRRFIGPGRRDSELS